MTATLGCARFSTTGQDLAAQREALTVGGVDEARLFSDTLTGAAGADRLGLAELELELGRERRAASRESRRARGLPATKPPKLSPERHEQLRRLAATGEPVAELAKVFGVGRATAYRYLQDSTA